MCSLFYIKYIQTVVVKNTLFSLEDIRDIKNAIDPKPQYQRTPVWKMDRKKLLVDSIFKGYDLPKFYLYKLKDNPLFDYEICDGQQRLRTIWDFLEDRLQTPDRTTFGNLDISNRSFSNIHTDAQSYFLDQTITVAVIDEATHDEIRDLFARLQNGVGLNQAELRRALSSSVGVHVESIVENHKFFNNCGIIDIRNKRQDYIDHAIAYLVNGVEKDFKGANLKEVYINVSPQDAVELIQKIVPVLNDMNNVNSLSKGIFKNKWGFLDSFILIYEMKKLEKKLDIKAFASSLVSFEASRKKAGRKNVEALLNTGAIEDERLYYYIMSFDKDGALKANVRQRRDLFKEQFKNAFK